MKITFKYLCITCLLFSFQLRSQDRTELHKRATKQATDLVGQMTLDEKVKLIEMKNFPIERLGIPGHDWWNEALHGVARRGKATQFPVSLSMASTWNPKLIGDMATAISDEARALHNADSPEDKTLRYHGLTLWSPVINMARDPRWGRNEESYGEEPFFVLRAPASITNIT